jgi:hypothetical protein
VRGLHPKGDARGDVRPDVRCESPLRALGRHDQVDAQGAANGSDPHQLGQGLRSVLDEHPELIDDEDQLGEGRSTRRRHAIGGQVRGTGCGKQLLTPADFCPQ